MGLVNSVTVQSVLRLKNIQQYSMDISVLDFYRKLGSNVREVTLTMLMPKFHNNAPRTEMNKKLNVQITHKYKYTFTNDRQLITSWIGHGQSLCTQSNMAKNK